ncbi:FAD:protein FMN transferase [Streptomycetaceae bacterium NBC_01309]
MRRVEHIMGLPISLHIAEGSAAGADPAFAWLREVDARFSPFRDDSEVCRLDRGELDLHEVSPDLATVLDLCEQFRVASGGAFDARLPGRALDPCAIVKGWAVQRAARLLTDHGARALCLNAGGDVVTVGGPWRIGIRHPETTEELCAVLEVDDAAVATSARYERGDHILDGRTGRPATELLSLTVLAPSLTEADATATAAFAMGYDGIAWAAAREGCEVYAVDADRQVFRTPGLPLAG